ncbi:pyridoxamine 5'-phosphate oxidase family protein [Phycicoccus sp. DTK01]|uniref:pyridoxamine 5'-phosphate oxidase family protein n=1 Tax=Phycicoccus sp. DTK01 TaxID=2785745 RepID=UPI001F5C1CFD|nr:pyridoxamine 5'-phosphate oxidase family protein [Phycicoccus sp. DTK01]
MTRRRASRLTMDGAELDHFLAQARTCRVATAGPEGPHVSPLWFLWLQGELWLNSVVATRRAQHLAADPRVAVVVDDGETYDRLRGVELRGRAQWVGEVPRRGAPDERLEAVEQGFHAKYRDPALPIPHDGRHAWLRLRPLHISSWDFRKISTRTEG